MINISLRSTDVRVQQALQNRRVKIRTAMTQEMDRLMLELERRIQHKLSGQVLQPRLGSLLGSVHKEATKEIVGRLSGRVTAGGGLASKYAIVQEKGGLSEYDIYPVNKKALAFFPSNSLGATSLRIQGNKLRFKLGNRRGSLRPSKYGEFANLGGVVVKHVVHPPLVARSYMKSSLLEMRDTILARLRAVLVREVS